MARARQSGARRRPWGARQGAGRAVLLPLLAVLGGCFTVDATLDADGSGRIVLDYIPGQNATRDSELARFTSAHVQPESVVAEESGARLTARFDDVTRLSTAEGFRMVSVTRRRKGHQERLHVVIRNPAPKPFRDEGQRWPRIALTLPGPVVSANRGAEVMANRAVWTLPLVDYAELPAVSVTVRWSVEAPRPVRPRAASPASTTSPASVATPPAGTAQGR